MPEPVLVVEDDDAIRRLVCFTLKRRGLSTDEARHGSEAIEKLSHHPYSAVVLDLMMPVRSGFDVVNYISDHQLESCVIVMTAAGARGTSRLDMDVVHEVIDKPFDVVHLGDLVSQCLSKHRATAASE